jgi:hypothetical protein
MSLTVTPPLRAALAAGLMALALAVTGASVAEAKSLKLKGDDTALTPNAETFGALTAAGFAVAPVGAAEARNDGSIAFPITRGRVNSKTLAGFIAHSGGLSITKDGTTVVARRYVIRTATKRPFLTAKVGGATIRFLELRGIERSDEGGKVVVTARATLARQAAKALNRAFGTDVFKKGTPIGNAEVTAST